MIRITTKNEPDHTVVTIDGRASAEDVAEIQQVRSSLTGEVVLHLGGLLSCTDEGIQVLHEWLETGAKLRKATLYLHMVLEYPPSLKE